MDDSHSKSASGRGAAVIVYGLFLGGIMLPPVVAVGVVIALVYFRRAAPWVQTHLHFLLWTFAGGAALLAAALLSWWLGGGRGMAARDVWLGGYLFAVVFLIWNIGRCGVGVYRLMGNRPVAGFWGMGSVAVGGVSPA